MTRNPKPPKPDTMIRELTVRDCPKCGVTVTGVNGRYACTACGWVNHWSEGNTPLPSSSGEDE